MLHYVSRKVLYATWREFVACAACVFSQIKSLFPEYFLAVNRKQWERVHSRASNVSIRGFPMQVDLPIKSADRCYCLFWITILSLKVLLTSLEANPRTQIPSTVHEKLRYFADIILSILSILRFCTRLVANKNTTQQNWTRVKLALLAPINPAP